MARVGHGRVAAQIAQVSSMVKQIFKILKSLINKTSSFKTTREPVSECFEEKEAKMGTVLESDTVSQTAWQVRPLSTTGSFERNELEIRQILMYETETKPTGLSVL